MRPPYGWVDDYRVEDIEVRKDEATGMLFVTQEGHKVFFPRKFDETVIRESVNIGLMEQDARSPHRYIGKDTMPDEGDVGVFIGASDGMFCLSLIDRLSKVYLFEPGQHWHEPMEATFAPWGDKVEIVRKGAGSEDTDDVIRLDSFFVGKTSPNFIQMDVDGVEKEVFSGANGVLKKAEKLRLSICTYHKRLDFSDFERLLGGMGYSIGHSPGFFLLGVRMPYFRRGVMYACRIKEVSTKLD